MLGPGLGDTGGGLAQLGIVGREARGDEEGLDRAAHGLEIRASDHRGLRSGAGAPRLRAQSALYVTQYSGVSHRRSSLSWGSCGFSRSQIQTITFSAVGLSRKSLSVW